MVLRIDGRPKTEGRGGEMEKGRRGESIVLNETFYIFCRLTASCRLPTANLMHGAKTLRR